MNLTLHGSCHVPIAGYCRETEAGLELLGLVGDVSTGRLVRAEAVGPRGEGQALGIHVAQKLLKAGAGEILAAL